jgi:hypothetical protein
MLQLGRQAVVVEFTFPLRHDDGRHAVADEYAVYAHLGYELYPRGFGAHWFGRWINTSVAHNTHHAKARYNYGWYFLFWDRMMARWSRTTPKIIGCAQQESSPRFDATQIARAGRA